jgi:hypothetical protein
MDDSEEPFDWACPHLEPCDVERQREVDENRTLITFGYVTKSHKLETTLTEERI